MTYLEDMAIGEIAALGEITVDRAEALDFAQKYDPQPFHLDDEAARAHPFFGRLAISGWQTCALAMRLIVKEMQDRALQGLGSPGVDELRWLKPVYPADRLTLRAETLEVRAFRSRPGIGSVKRRFTFTNQDGIDVMTMLAVGLMATRPDGGSG